MSCRCPRKRKLVLRRPAEAEKVAIAVVGNQANCRESPAHLSDGRGNEATQSRSARPTNKQ